MYRPTFSDGKSREQYRDLPPDGRAALDELMRAVCLVPYNFMPRPPQAAYGSATSSALLDFADGLGLVTVQVYDPDLEVVIWDIQWFG